MVAKEKNTEKEQIVGKCILVHLPEKQVNVTLVPLKENLNLQPKITEIQQFYTKVGVNLAISVDIVFHIMENISTENQFGDLSTYSPDQQHIISAYTAQRSPKSNVYYIFVGEQASSQQGYMRLGGQFGFVMDNNARTIAHELGHGIFKLEHPFKKDKSQVGKTTSIMDYGSGTDFLFPEWKQIGDPKLKIYAFQGQEEGEMVFSNVSNLTKLSFSKKILADFNLFAYDLQKKLNISTKVYLVDDNTSFEGKEDLAFLVKFENNDLVIKNIFFPDCSKKDNNAIIKFLCSLPKARHYSLAFLRDALDWLTKGINYLEIPERFYNVEHKDYNPILFYIGLVESTNSSIFIGDQFTGANNAEVMFATKCGIWNGLVGQLSGLSDVAALLVDFLIEGERIDQVWEGLKRLDIFCTESKGDNICIWSVIKDSHTKGNKYQIGHQIGVDIAEVLTFYISFAKAGKLANIAKIMEVADVSSHLIKTFGKVLQFTIEKGNKFVITLKKGVHFVRDNQFVIKSSGNLYCGFPVFDIKIIRKSTQFTQKEIDDLTKAVEDAIKKQGGIDKLPTDENGIRLVEVELNGEKITVTIGNENQLNKLAGTVDNFLSSIDPKVLEKLKNVPGFDKVLEDMTTHWKKFKGGKFQLEYFSKKIENLQGTLRFEVPQTLIIDGNEVARVYDATVEYAGKITKYELKNWAGWYPSSVKKQFIKDIQNIEKLDELKWVFNTTSGINKNNLKEKIINTLKKADGTPIEEVKKLFEDTEKVNKFKKMFDDNRITKAQDLLKKLEDDKVFNQIFEIVE